MYPWVVTTTLLLTQCSAVAWVLLVQLHLPPLVQTFLGSCSP